MISIKQLNGIAVETIHEAFAKAFSDYVEPFDLTYEQLKHMIERRGYNPELSFGAFNGDELVGFTLNGIGEWDGKLTAYDTGTGIIKEFRKQGIASKMFNESLPVLKENNIEQYLLEVICSNKPAYDLYRKAGFEVTRELDYYVSTKDKIEIKENKLITDLALKEINNPDWDLLKSFWDFKPSWQNSIDSINRKREYFKILGVFDKDKIAGYGIVEKHTGDIPQIAVDKNYRQKGLASTILYNLFQHSEVNNVKFINSEASDDSFKKFASCLNLSPGIGQYEMLLKF